MNILTQIFRTAPNFVSAEEELEENFFATLTCCKTTMVGSRGSGSFDFDS